MMDKESRAVRLARLARGTAAAEESWRESMRERDAEVDQADSEGWGVRELARTTGLAPQTILRILVRVEKRRQQKNRATSA